MTVEEAVARIERDPPFHDSSQGGVTLSGGDPLRQAGFAVAVLAVAAEVLASYGLDPHIDG